MTAAVRVRRFAAGAIIVTILGACTPVENPRRARSTLVLGIDVSGSFEATGNYNDAIEFASHYLYGHLGGLGELAMPSAVFVGSVGGENPGETKSFQPIHAFQGKSPEEIATVLREQFPSRDGFTDFNAFFDRVATLVKRQGLILAPLNIVLLTDGIQDLTADSGTESRFATIDLGPLEYLSRSVTVRLLYATPTVSVAWEREIDRRRVRMWTVDHEVMAGWREQLEFDINSGGAEDNLWKWVQDNIDFRVRTRVL
ncbi:MAG: hypothetical protein IIA55_02240 [Gemmatimonadetes bacterium]|nr:hypothetical protein [Gemmatimonadota bacterium]